MLPKKWSPPWNEGTCSDAAFNRLECLKYLHENGCPWDGETCSYAVKMDLLRCRWDEVPSNGRLKCLQYANENGCPWMDEYTLFEIFARKRMESR